MNAGEFVRANIHHGADHGGQKLADARKLQARVKAGAEKTTFSPAVSIAFAKRPDTLPEGFLEDRAKFSGRNIDPIAMMAAVPNLLDQAARRPHAGVSQDHRVLLPRAFRHRAGYELAAALGEIGV